MKMFDIAIDALTQPEALTRIHDFLGQKGNHSIVFVNPEAVVRATHDSQFVGALRDASLRLPDGVGLLWAARTLGTPIPANLNGTDLFPSLCTLFAKENVRVYLFGATQPVVAEAARRLLAEFPGIQVVGYHHGYIDEDEKESMAHEIAKTKADVVIVALGTPLQEYWIERYKTITKARILLGMGGILDFYSGSVKRAPAWIRSMNVEWLWRLCTEPWRWKRQLALIEFVLLVLRKKLSYVS